MDRDRARSAIEAIGRLARGTRRPEVIGEIGGFGGLFLLNRGRYRDPVLVASTDGVGTKLKIAFLLDRHDTVGRDLVAMGVNDIITAGAEPLFFLDYIATGRIEPAKIAAVVGGIAEGCREAGCALLGGETAEMPGFYAPGEYELAGFALGVVEKEKIIDGRRVVPGDVLVGLASSGLHSNGFSLVRKVLLGSGRFSLADIPPGLERSLGEELLEPTRIYARAVRRLLCAVDVRGLAHITGGGLMENIPRGMPPGVRARIRRGSWREHPVFGLVRREGDIPDAEMFRVFNMGIGMVALVARECGQEALRALADAGEEGFLIGEVVGEGSGVELVDERR